MAIILKARLSVLRVGTPLLDSSLVMVGARILMPSGSRVLLMENIWCPGGTGLAYFASLMMRIAGMSMDCMRKDDC